MEEFIFLININKIWKKNINILNNLPYVQYKKMSRFTLNIKTENNTLINKYSVDQSSHDGDSGIDLFTPEEVVFIPGETKLNLS